MINIPLIVVWYFAFIGYARLHQYARSLKTSQESTPFHKLAKGSAWLAWSLPITAIVRHILNALSNDNSSFKPAGTIITNYTDLIMPFVAFLIIGAATRGIISSQKIELNPIGLKIMMALFLIIGILYCYLMLRAFNLNSLSSTQNPFALPAWLMIITIIIPYLYAWFIGLLAAYEITLYALKVPGYLYKRALFILVGGLTAIIVSFIANQYAQNVWQTNDHLIFNLKLVLSVLFVLIGGIGFILMAIGANQLKRFEEI